MISNPDNFIESIKKTIFERSQDFQKQHSDEFKNVLRSCKLDYLTLLKTHGIDETTTEFLAAKSIWEKVINAVSSILSGRRSRAYTQLKNILNEVFCVDLVYTQATYSGRSPFTFSGDIRSLNRWLMARS